MVLLVNTLGVLLIGFIIWWFWLSKNQQSIVKANDMVVIKVKDGVYDPTVIEVKLNRPITLRFIREDASPCAETVVFNTLNISKTLPLNLATDLHITLTTPGDYEFTCQMGMYRGRLISR